MNELRVRGFRGATTTDENDKQQIIDRTSELLQELMSRNGVDEDNIVGIIFTMTEDLNAEFPAAAARMLGFTTVPLLCAREIDVPSSIPRCIRVLLHAYSDKSPAELRHVYLHNAKHLRTDLPE